TDFILFRNQVDHLLLYFWGSFLYKHFRIWGPPRCNNLLIHFQNFFVQSSLKVNLFQLVQKMFIHSPIPSYLRKPIVDQDRKSTSLNSSHVKISYAVFCLKKKI